MLHFEDDLFWDFFTSFRILNWLSTTKEVLCNFYEIFIDKLNELWEWPAFYADKMTSDIEKKYFTVILRKLRRSKSAGRSFCQWKTITEFNATKGKFFLD